MKIPPTSKPLSRRPRLFSWVSTLAMLAGGLWTAQADWAQWRGPAFNGSTAETNLPTAWNATNQVVWKTALPGPSAATPVVSGGWVFLLAADEQSKEVSALGVDASNGKILWRESLGADQKISGSYDLASPSPVTDGTNVWFLAGNGRLKAFTRAGRALWQRDLSADYGEFAANFGYCSSPLLYAGRLYVQALHKNGSYFLALDPASGKTLWKQERPTDATEQSRESYATPYPFERPGHREILLVGGECLTGHDPVTGQELWRWWFTPEDRQKLQHNVPTPVGCGDLVYVIRPEHRPLYAVRAGGTGKLGTEALAWIWPTNRSWIATPLVYQNRLYVMQEQERELACLEPQTGRVIWQHKLGVNAQLQASPLGADGKIFCVSLSGEVVILAAGDEYREVARTRFADDGQCRSTLVADHGQIYLRTGKNLYCFGGKAD